MTEHSFCKHCGAPLIAGSKVCPCCNTRTKERSPVGAFFLGLLKCLGYYGFFFGVQLAVSFVYEIMVMISLLDLSAPGGFSFSEEEFYAVYSRFAPEIGIISALLVLFGYFLFFLIRKKNMFREFFGQRIGPAALASSFTLGLTSQVMLSIGLAFLYAFFPFLSDYSNSETYELLFQNSNPVTEFINIAVVTAILEEVVFRGLIYNTLKKVSSVKMAIFLSAVIFGAAHMNIEQFFYTSLLGVLMAMVYEKYKNLAAPIIVHAAFNGSNYLMTSLSFAQDGPYLCIFFYSVAIFLLVFTFVFLTKKVPVSLVQKNRKA